MDGFDRPTGRTPSRVKNVEIRLIISEDDISEVPAVAAIARIPAVIEVLDSDTGVVITPASAAIPAVPAVAAVPARTDTMYNGSYRFDILDQNGDVMARRSGEVNPHLTSTRRGHAKGILDAVMVLAKGSVS